MLELRAAGYSWRDIGKRLGGRDQTVCRRRWDKLGGNKRLLPPRAKTPAAPSEPPLVDNRGNREPLPAGHPISWGAIALPWQMSA